MGLLEQFEGHWRLYRLIEDRLTKQRLIFEGRAELHDDGKGLTYLETGRWTKSEWGSMAASRKLLWREDPFGIAVLYEDERPFHTFAVAAGGSSKSGHDCAPDRYDVTYRFQLPDRWEADWQASGPKKDYTSRTRYDREDLEG